MTMSKEKLQESIRTCGITQAEIYRQTGVHQSCISKYMRGVSDMSYRNAYKLEVFFQKLNKKGKSK